MELFKKLSPTNCLRRYMKNSIEYLKLMSDGCEKFHAYVRSSQRQGRSSWCFPPALAAKFWPPSGICRISTDPLRQSALTSPPGEWELQHLCADFLLYHHRNKTLKVDKENPRFNEEDCCKIRINELNSGSWSRREPSDSKGRWRKETRCLVGLKRERQDVESNSCPMRLGSCTPRYWHAGTHSGVGAVRTGRILMALSCPHIIWGDQAKRTREIS